MKMKTVLITGISRGIGKALAKRFLANVDFVIGTSTRGSVDYENENLTVFPLDLSKPETIKECVKKINSLNKKIDILINNSGIWSGEDGPKVHIEPLRKLLEVNLIGTIDFTQQILSSVKEDGHIVNISSRKGSMELTTSSDYPGYNISKAAENMFTRVLAAQLKGKIIVSSVHPGWVKTDMGGQDAEMEPEEAAEHIFKLANSKVETGQFWFKGKKLPW
jgi:NAD(P)-dependent dehydrogenase (short-subunit alcohol dehydrogenase family)